MATSSFLAVESLKGRSHPFVLLFFFKDRFLTLAPSPSPPLSLSPSLSLSQMEEQPPVNQSQMNWRQQFSSVCRKMRFVHGAVCRPRSHCALMYYESPRASLISGPKIHFLAADRPIVVINPSLADNIAAEGWEGTGKGFNH